MKEEPDKKLKRAPASSYLTGVVALVFLAIGYQTALFIHTASVEKIISGRDEPDTVFVYEESEGAGYPGRAQAAAGGHREQGRSSSRRAGKDVFSGNASTDGRPQGRNSGGSVMNVAGEIVGKDAESGLAKSTGVFQSRADGGRQGTSGSASADGTANRRIVRKNASHTDEVLAVRAANPPAVPELFRFDPNTASVDELVRLGFSAKQASSIVNYRKKGGRFRRKSDFARSYVVSEEIYARLEPYIDIPRVDLNRADSAALDALPGIGPYFVKKIIAHRAALGGYSYPEQLMDIYHFDEEKFFGLADLVTVSSAEAYPLWTLPADSLRRHPYIGAYGAEGIVRYRKYHPESEWTIDGLAKARVLRPEDIDRLRKCRIADP